MCGCTPGEITEASSIERKLKYCKNAKIKIKQHFERNYITFVFILIQSLARLRTVKQLVSCRGCLENAWSTWRRWRRNPHILRINIHKFMNIILATLPFISFGSFGIHLPAIASAQLPITYHSNQQYEAFPLFEMKIVHAAPFDSV